MKTLIHTVPETAGYLRLGRTTVCRLIATGSLAPILIDGSRRIAADALTGYLEALGAR